MSKLHHSVSRGMIFIWRVTTSCKKSQPTNLCTKTHPRALLCLFNGGYEKYPYIDRKIRVWWNYTNVYCKYILLTLDIAGIYMYMYYIITYTAGNRGASPWNRVFSSDYMNYLVQVQRHKLLKLADLWDNFFKPWLTIL